MGRPRGSKNRPKPEPTAPEPSAPRRCAGCAYFAPRTAGPDGWCHRYPPATRLQVQGATDWCGEWRAMG